MLTIGVNIERTKSRSGVQRGLGATVRAGPDAAGTGSAVDDEPDGAGGAGDATGGAAGGGAAGGGAAGGGDCIVIWFLPEERDLGESAPIMPPAAGVCQRE